MLQPGCSLSGPIPLERRLQATRSPFRPPQQQPGRLVAALAPQATAGLRMTRQECQARSAKTTRSHRSGWQCARPCAPRVKIRPQPRWSARARKDFRQGSPLAESESRGQQPHQRANAQPTKSCSGASSPQLRLPLTRLHTRSSSRGYCGTEPCRSLKLPQT